MSDTLSLQVTGLDRVVVQLAAMPEAIRAAILGVVTEEAIRLETVVKEEKLTGQVLKNHSEKLRSSIHHQVEATSDTVTGIVAAAMGKAGYARFWEYGFTGTEQVREHLRHMTQAFGRPLETPRDVLVKAHPRAVNQPARSYLRSTLAENQAVIRTRIHDAAIRAVRHES